MLAVLISGRLVRAPEQRMGRSGKPFCTALVSTPVEGDEAMLVSVIAFGAVADALAALGQSDAVSIAGDGKLTTWTGKDGGERHGLSVTAHRVLSAYQRRATQRAQAAASEGDR